jgi:spore maturation protein CgeB
VSDRQARAGHGRLVIAGGAGGTNVGDSLRRAALARGIDAELVDTRAAYSGSRMMTGVNWWIRGRRPNRLEAYGRDLATVCRRLKPARLLATGLAPVDRKTLEEIGSLGIVRLNYLTDDPWNPAFRSRWFLDALSGYDRVFSTRRANLEDLARHGCREVTYLPFGFDPELFYPEEPTPEERQALAADVFFAGGADRDRAPLIGALADAGLSVALYGDYWDRFAETRRLTRGHATPEIVRKSLAACAVALCLVRRANRDGHAMRSLEVPAAGGCMLAEDSEEHRALFGESGVAAVYFRTIPEMVDAARHLVTDARMRARLSREAHRVVTEGRHTYADRLDVMLADVA